MNVEPMNVEPMNVESMSVDSSDQQETTPALHEEYLRYRAISTSAVVSLALGLLSILTFFGWSLGAFPILGLVLGLRAIWQIKSRPNELTGLALARGGVILSALFLLAGWGWLGYVYATEVPKHYVRLHYDTLEPDPETPNVLPSRAALKLDGQKVFLKGFMHPQVVSSRQLLLCQDSGDCCFGGKPSPADMVLVKFKRPMRSPTYTTWQVKLGGVFHVRPVKVGQVGGVIYQIEADYLP